MSVDEVELLTRVAWLHFMEGVTQREIARHLGLSQPKVARLLDKAQKCGIVRISIASPYANCLRIEGDLRRCFPHLKDVVVVPTPKSGNLFESLGRAGAWYLERVLQDGDLVGIAWGRTLKSVASALQGVQARNLKFVTLVGGLTASASLNPYTIGEKLASIFGGECYYLYAPAVVESEEVRNFYLSERINQKTLELARKAHWSIVGIGAVDAQHSIYALTGFIDYHELELIRSKGGVGDILGQFYDLKGEIIDTPLHRRTVALPLEDLRTMQNVIGIAGGKEKVEAILGALRGKYINILITDEHTAQRIVELETKGG
ncbi:MAG: sugar-binding transcriptional regulator [Candidatus Caldatribacterium sp.]|uniref:sugar-binding transcriptional regulator n=1 Tax=Candidatus Caldatribacterium sp. TaxID=2282143 RepID=UPI002998B0F9|nr:sugar-binding transcriptional regulator [Candidatus Caldatribacterium sp.]MCX7730315.1 sugar-binding transcriptional regulator [Candidatus Caldatribacterium sp.]MDW8081094.1 sugar-binding transcriptional regulator [Candidatus Calescibacterium sp.]